MKKTITIILAFLLISTPTLAADVKISQLTEASSASSNDLLLISAYSGGVYSSKKITFANFATSIGGTVLTCTANYPVLGTGQCGSAAIGTAAYKADTYFQIAGSYSTTTMATDTLWDAAGDLAQGSGANTGEKLTKGAEGTILRAGATKNAYTTSTFADTYAKGTFLYAATANTIASLAHPGAANYILTTNAADTSAWLASSANMISLLGSTDYATARTNLGLAIGTNVQAYDANTAKGPGTSTANHLAKFANTDGVTLADGGAVSTDNSTASHFLYKDGDGHIENATVTGTGTTMVLSTGPSITLPQVEIHGVSDPLTAAQVSGSIITNYGADGADTTTLPAAAAGYNFIAINATKYDGDWLIHTGGSNDVYIDLGDGTLLSGKNHIIFHNAEVGCQVTCYSFRSGASAYSWRCQSASSTTCPHSATGGIDTD